MIGDASTEEGNNWFPKYLYMHVKIKNTSEKEKTV